MHQQGPNKNIWVIAGRTSLHWMSNKYCGYERFGEVNSLTFVENLFLLYCAQCELMIQYAYFVSPYIKLIFTKNHLI